MGELEEQKTDRFYREVRSRQSATKDSNFEEDEEGILIRKTASRSKPQVAVPHSLEGRLLEMSHSSKAAGHPVQTRMYETLSAEYYWPAMAADIANHVAKCASCARSRVKLRQRSNYF